MVLHLIYFSTKVDKLWELLTKMLYYTKKGYKKLQSQALKWGVTKNIRKNLYMASHVSDMKRLRKLKFKGKDVKGNNISEKE